MMKCAVAGHTGEVGGHVVRSLLKSPQVSDVVCVGRRAVTLFNDEEGAEKLSQLVVDFDTLSCESEGVLEMMQGCETVFCTVGVGARYQTREELHRVDVEYVSRFATVCKAAGARHFSLLGAVGANSKSPIALARAKGAAEVAVSQVQFPRTSFFRPAMISSSVPRRVDWLDPVRRLGRKTVPMVEWMLGQSQYRSVAVHDLSAAMVANALLPGASGKSGEEILTWTDFNRLVQQVQEISTA